MADVPNVRAGPNLPDAFVEALLGHVDQTALNV